MVDKQAQGEAARRIMEKLGPLTAEERLTYDLLTRRPDEYVPPVGENRLCAVCGKTFQGLEAFADHQVEHNPPANQWTLAHRRISEGRSNAKHSEGQ